MTSNQRKAAAAGAVAAIAIGIAGVLYAQAPIRALTSIKESAQRGDTDDLNRRIDFPALKASLKNLITEAVAPQATERPGPRSFFARMMVGAVASPIVDAMVTPDSIALMFSGVIRAPGTPSDSKLSTEPGQPHFTMSSEWKDLSYVRVHLRADGTRPEELVFLMKRDGFHWQLVGIER